MPGNYGGGGVGRQFARYPLFLLASVFAAGSFLLRDHSALPMMVAAAAFFAGLAALARVKTRLAVLFLCGAFLFGGGAAIISADRSRETNSIRVAFGEGLLVSGEPVEVRGTIYAGPDPRFEGIVFDLDAAAVVHKGREEGLSGRVRLFADLSDPEARARFDALELEPGAEISAAFKMMREEKYRNPGGRSLVGYLDLKGIDATGSIKAPELIEAHRKAPVSISLIAHRIRRGLITRARTVLGEPAGSLVVSSTLGERSSLRKDISESFRSGGTFHLLVISGLHITFAGALAWFLVSGMTKNRIARAAFSLSAVWCFAFLSGLEIPALRASLMMTVVLGSGLLFRQPSLLNSVGAGALAILVWKPDEVFDPSFHLTISSVTGIAAFGFPLLKKLRSVGEWHPCAEHPFPPQTPSLLTGLCDALYWSEAKWRREQQNSIWKCGLFKTDLARRLSGTAVQKIARLAFESALLSLSVQLFLLPLLIIYFHRVSYASFFLNLPAGFLLILQNLVAGIAVALHSFSSEASMPAAYLARTISQLIILLHDAAIATTGAYVRVPTYDGAAEAVYFIYYIPLALSSAGLARWNPFRRAASARIAAATISAQVIILLILVAHPFSRPQADGRLRVDFLDVGQGDAALVTFPDGTTMLVDGGGMRPLSGPAEGEQEWDVQTIGEKVVAEFLWEKGYANVDLVLATHGDADHVQGLEFVSANFAPGTVFVPAGYLDPDQYGPLVEAARSVDARVRRLGADDRFTIAGAMVEVLNPDARDVNSRNDGNDSSIVLRISFGSRRILLTGDIERKAEEKLEAGKIRADVVKVAHHGSRTSSGTAFVESSGARIAVIPVGTRSPYGHPDAAVVRRWKESGAIVLTTGENGTVTVSTDGRDLEVRTQAGGQAGKKQKTP